MTDDLSIISAGSLAALSMGSQSSRGILKKKTIQESLNSSISNMSHGSCVTFDSVEISCHPITLGVNPSVADGGPPIEIEWESQSYEMTSVDDFEQARVGTDRCIKKLSPQDRIDLLIKSGFSREELIKTEDEMCDIRLMREMSKRRARVRRCNSSPPETLRAMSGGAPSSTGSSRSNNKDSNSKQGYGKLIKKLRLKRSNSSSNSNTNGNNKSDRQ